jgi:AsmA protein
LNPVKSKYQKSLFRIITVSFLSLASLIILYFSILFILFLVFKNDISTTILIGVNNKIEGKISFSDLSFTPFRHFPNASLILNDLNLTESKDSNSNSPPVLNIKEAYVSLNLIDLFSSRINVTDITFEGGNLNIIVYPDSQSNLEKAIKKVKLKEIFVEQKHFQVDTTISKSNKVTEEKLQLVILIDNLEIDNLTMLIDNQLTRNKLITNINRLQSEFSYKNNQIISSLNLDTHVDSLLLGDKLILADKKINFKSDLEVETDSIFVKVRDGNISIGEAKFNFNGIFDSKNDGYVDLSVFISDNDLSLFSLFLNENQMQNLKAGDLYFKASIKGKSYTELPVADVTFGFNNVELINPITKRKIKNLNLTGHFNSGKKEDLSQALLTISNLNAEFPDGKLKLSGSVSNFDQPEFDTDLLLKADVTGLDKVFKLDFLDNLKGKIEISDRFKGKFIKSEKRFASEINIGKIYLENFGFNIPGTIKFDKVNGIISRKNDDYSFDSLSIISNDTDVLINGEIKNLQYLFFNIEKEINADLTIKSSIFDLPNFLAFDPSIKRDFNYRLLNVDIDVLAKSTTSKALKFKSFPEIDFDIKKLYATIEKFLPRLQIKSGNFKISESILGFNMKFDKFKTDFLNGNFNFTAEYNSSKYEPLYIKAKTDFKDIYLSKLFYNEKGTIPESMKGKLSGSFLTDLQFPLDSTLLKFIRIKKADLVYEFSKDTIATKDLNVDLNKIYFNEKINSNPFATLYTNGRIKADIIKSNSFNFNYLDFNVDVSNGKYKIKSNVVRIFGENAKGNAIITATPFTKIPSFRIIYNDISFRAEKMLSAFKEDQIMSGPLNLSFNVSSSGSEWDSIVSNMNGTIKLSGEGLVLNGFDADEIIENFKRSQNFNLVDLGAVLLAGPVGIAVTKGSDFARILAFNSGKFTNINKLVSNWTVNNGVFEIQDAAFRTNINRIALTGLIGFANQNIDLTIALLNKYGCSIFSQQVYGNLDAPTLGKVKVVGTLLAPVTNLVDDVTGKDCDVFYSGSVEHPINKQKKN